MKRALSFAVVVGAVSVAACGGSAFQSAPGSAGAGGSSVIAGGQGGAAEAGQSSAGGSAGAGGAGASAGGSGGQGGALGALGDPCTDGSACASGTCLVLPAGSDNPGVCSLDCDATTTCPEAWDCFTIAPKTVPVQVCVPTCDTSVTCTPYIATWTCNRSRNLDGTDEKRCGAWQNLGYGMPCTGDAQCTGGDCTGTETSDEGYCISSNECASKADCCGTDASCVADCVQTMAKGPPHYFCQRSCAVSMDCSLLGESKCAPTVTKAGAKTSACY